MGVSKIGRCLKIAGGMKGKSTLASQKHSDAIIQPNAYDYQDLSVRSGLLHAYCGSGFSFDTAKCCLLFYDWYVQKIRMKKVVSSKL